MHGECELENLATSTFFYEVANVLSRDIGVQFYEPLSEESNLIFLL